MKNLLIFIFMTIPKIALCQEVFIDTTTNRINISLGALNARLDSLKTLEDGVVGWKPVKNLEQQDLLSGEQFIAKVFDSKLHFTLEGYEPFWSMTVAKDGLTFTNFEPGETKRLEVEIHTATRGMNPRFYFMFKTVDNDVWGVVNYVGWNPREQQKCECDISDEISLSEAYVCINGEIFRGCATIENHENPRDI